MDMTTWIDSSGLALLGIWLADDPPCRDRCRHRRRNFAPPTSPLADILLELGFDRVMYESDLGEPLASTADGWSLEVSRQSAMASMMSPHGPFFRTHHVWSTQLWRDLVDASRYIRVVGSSVPLDCRSVALFQESLVTGIALGGITQGLVSSEVLDPATPMNERSTPAEFRQ